MAQLELIIPSVLHLSQYLAALKSGWSPDNVRIEVAAKQIADIEKDENNFFNCLAIEADDHDAKAKPIMFPDGSIHPRLSGIIRWISDGDFCGNINLRWQKGTGELPSYVLGHIGYSIVPWKQKRGYATQALALILELARNQGLPYVQLVTDIDNIASQRVILANGGALMERFRQPPQYCADIDVLRYRIRL